MKCPSVWSIYGLNSPGMSKNYQRYELLPFETCYQETAHIYLQTLLLFNCRTSMVFRNQSWEAIDPLSETPLQYLNIDLNGRMIDEPFSKRVEFWKSFGLI